MPYVKPDDVTSPQDSWSLNCVFYDEGEGGIAIAFGEWDGEPVLAIRWNGTNELHKELGNPQSSGHATWFILPPELAITIVKEILTKHFAGNNHIRPDCIPIVIAWLKNIGKLTADMY